jgi:hypothetical protein
MLRHLWPERPKTREEWEHLRGHLIVILILAVPVAYCSIETWFSVRFSKRSAS